MQRNQVVSEVRIVVAGTPAAGTQAVKPFEKLGVPQVSTGTQGLHRYVQVEAELINFSNTYN